MEEGDNGRITAKIFKYARGGRGAGAEYLTVGYEQRII